MGFKIMFGMIFAFILGALSVFIFFVMDEVDEPDETDWDKEDYDFMKEYKAEEEKESKGE
jgi:hypothetical protein